MGLLARAVCGFLIALCCTPAGVSGAFLLLPLQIHVFDAPSPAVSATNLVYNTIATPTGALTYRRRGNFDRRLAAALVAGTTPGVVVGALLRATWFSSASTFAWIAAIVLSALGLRLVFSAGDEQGDPDASTWRSLPIGRLVLIGAIGGTIGGIYGFGGAAVIVPWLVSIERLPVPQIAGPALVATLVTSIVGLVTFAVAARLEVGEAQVPDWPAGVAFGIGGAAGAVLGARVQSRIPTSVLRMGLGVVALVAGVRTVI